MRISTVDQLLDLLDELTPARADSTSRQASQRWAEILTRAGHPLNSGAPDVNLLAWEAMGLLPEGSGRRALDIGCGLGRNARWLADRGWSVLGIDVSAPLVAAAAQTTDGRDLEFADCDFLRDQVPGGPFDLVYDSGCFHHVAPHRRISYLAALDSVLAPEALFGICTFTQGEMGATDSDAELLVSGRFGDGIGYSAAELAEIFGHLTLLDAGPQMSYTAPVEAFTQAFLTVALFERPQTTERLR